MYDDISKILKSITKGVVVMEDGKPAYVVVPFEEYKESMKAKKIEGVRMWADPRQQQLDDATVIQKLIDYDRGVSPQDILERRKKKSDRSLIHLTENRKKGRLLRKTQEKEVSIWKICRFRGVDASTALSITFWPTLSLPEGLTKPLSFLTMPLSRF